MEDYKLKATNFELELNHDEDYNPHHPPVIYFCSELFRFQPEQGSYQYDDLVKAIDNNTTAGIDWSPANGDCSIDVGNGIVEFQVGKYGDGCGGFLSIGLPAHLCRDAFACAAQITSAWKK